MLSIRKVRLLITSRYIAMQSYECVIISKMFLIYFISYGCNGGALVFHGGAEASASPSFALPMFITIKKIIILHLFLGVPAVTVGGTGTPWHTRGYAPDIYIGYRNLKGPHGNLSKYKFGLAEYITVYVIQLQQILQLLLRIITQYAKYVYFKFYKMFTECFWVISVLMLLLILLFI